MVCNMLENTRTCSSVLERVVATKNAKAYAIYIVISWAGIQNFGAD